MTAHFWRFCLPVAYGATKQLTWISAIFSSVKNTWAIVDLKGKAGHTRTIPMPAWVKHVLDQWLQGANITSGKLFRRLHKIGKSWGEGLTEKAVWRVVREYAAKTGVDKLAPHDLRRTCARLCHAAGGELEQIQFLLGHVSIQTTERYLGCKQRIRGAVNDKMA